MANNLETNQKPQTRYGVASEVETLLNLIQEPAVIINRTENIIIAANTQFFLLTGFEPEEIIGINFYRLFLEKLNLDASIGESQRVTLSHKNAEALPVLLKLSYLNNLNSLAQLTPVQIFQTNQDDRQSLEFLLKYFNVLIEISAQPDISSTLGLVVSLTKKLLNCECIAIYKAQGEHPVLSKEIQSNSALCDFFPETLTTQDLSCLSKPMIWKPSKPSQSDLHIAAQDAQLTFLASAPLGQENAWFGLLVAGDPHNLPSSNVLSLLKLIARQTSSAMEHQIAMNNARTTIQKIKQVIMIERQIVENIEEGVIILSSDLSVAELNPSAEMILGYTSSEVIRQPIESILIGNETLVSAYNSALQGIPTLITSDLKLHHRNGKSFPAQIMTVPILSEGRISSIIIILRDISQTEQILSRTRQLEQRAVLGEVTAIFAHEVRNPINSISTGLQLMGVNMAKDDPNQVWIERLQNDCQRINHLMESVLSFSRPMEYRMAPIDLTGLLPKIIERWRPRMKRSKIDPYFQCIASHTHVTGDARALEQVFTNLISNSVQAMSTNGGSLAIKVQNPQQQIDPPQVEIVVSDTGPGIPEDILDHIFEPFISNSPNGTGLGLAITKRIITAHKGNVNVESYPGGTVFHILLPAAKGEKA